LPEFKRVIVAFGNQIAMEETLDNLYKKSSAANPRGKQ
jgi:hypothetical protein